MRRGGELECDRVPLAAITEAVGTPVYVYSASRIRERYADLTSALKGMNARVHYSVKANSSIAVLALLRRMGAGVDIVSGGELYRARCAGFTGRDVVFSGVGKTTPELEDALRAGVLMINVESAEELSRLVDIAARLGVVAPVALRVNPDVSVDTPHPYTRTGERGMKFGIPHDEVVQLARVAAESPSIALVGLAAHLGSQISRVEPFRAATERLLELHDELRANGVQSIAYLDVGGGLAVSYRDESALDARLFAATVRPLVARAGLELIIEPGRFLVADAGALVTRVLYRKRSGGKEIIITDAGMNDLLRPSHYNAYHAIDAVSETDGEVVADVVGPVCESGDFFALDRTVGDVKTGGLLAIRTTGAYGHVMASNYNSRPRPPEVIVDDGRFAVVTARESYSDLVRHESATPEWRSP